MSVLVGTGKQSRCLKTASDGADATWRGRSFQTVAPETGNARLPTVYIERRTGGTSIQTSFTTAGAQGSLLAGSDKLHANVNNNNNNNNKLIYIAP